MKKSLIILVIVTIFILSVPSITYGLSKKKDPGTLDVTEVNQLIKEIEKSDDMIVSNSSGKYSIDYTILDIEENVLYTSLEQESETAHAMSIVEATKERDTIRDIYVDGKQ